MTTPPNCEISKTFKIGGIKMNWSTSYSGKSKGKSLPQVIFSDQDWFYWAVEAEIFEGKLNEESGII